LGVVWRDLGINDIGFTNCLVSVKLGAMQKNSLGCVNPKLGQRRAKVCGKAGGSESSLDFFIPHIGTEGRETRGLRVEETERWPTRLTARQKEVPRLS
jgi:hypothetical protein